MPGSSIGHVEEPQRFPCAPAIGHGQRIGLKGEQVIGTSGQQRISSGQKRRFGHGATE
jgi:hypothetical protein